MAAAARLIFSPLKRNYTRSFGHRHISSQSSPHSSTLRFEPSNPKFIHKSIFSCASGGSGGDGMGRGGSGGGGEGHNEESRSNGNPDESSWFGPIGAFMNGWRSRVSADPQFPFKVLMEELVGVSACLLGDMASRPNFGLDELDFVFSTLVVGSIMNFVLMYLLAPTMATSTSTLPLIFASCPTSHMFEPGPYGALSRIGTFVYKGALFTAVGFVAGLIGTALSNSLIKMRKKMDPTSESPNKPPPMVLNAATWAIHMGLSSNFRYQTLNGVEFVLAKSLPGAVFKTSVVVLRCLNNILGGVSFVVLARLTGSQSVESKMVVYEETAVAEEENLLDKPDESTSDESA